MDISNRPSTSHQTSQSNSASSPNSAEHPPVVQNPSLSGDSNGHGAVLPSPDELDAALVEADNTHEMKIVRSLFSVPDLVEAGIKACNKSGLSYIKLVSCGAFNKVYGLAFTDGTEAIARLPHATSNPRRHSVWPDRIKSEVATMKYAKRHLKPEFAALVPEVYGWDPTSDNPVGQPYIVMQKMNGSTLESCWEKATLAQKEGVVKQLAYFTFAMRNIGTEFKEIGNIYYNDEKDTFYVGSFVEKSPSLRHDIPGIDRGPWPTSPDFLLAQARNRQRLGHASVFRQADDQNRLKGQFQTPISEIVAHLNSITSFAPQFAATTVNNVCYSDQKRSLFHDDLHVNNILINPETMELSGILDWEAIAICPDWLSMSIPICLDGPDVYSEKSELDCIQEFHRSHYMEMTELRDWYSAVRSSVDPGFHRKVAAYKSLRRIYKAIFIDWSDIWEEEEGTWIEEELRRQNMI
jgi:Phosphotransferase enzyme family